MLGVGCWGRTESTKILLVDFSYHRAIIQKLDSLQLQKVILDTLTITAAEPHNCYMKYCNYFKFIKRMVDVINIYKWCFAREIVWANSM